MASCSITFTTTKALSITHHDHHPIKERKYLLIKPSSNDVTRQHQHHFPVIHCTQQQQQEQQVFPWQPRSSDDLLFSDAAAEIETKTALPRSLPRWPVWVAGPAVLLAAGAGPALWLRIPGELLGPNVVTLLALTGLDCLFNLGANLFLLAAHCIASAAAPRAPPRGYRLWSLVAAAAGLVAPAAALAASWRGWAALQPGVGAMGAAVVAGPYALLLGVQAGTEALTWRWGSGAWAVAPVVYGGYRVAQLMRGLRMGAEIGAPEWALQGVRGLVAWWVLALGVHLMWVASLAASADHHHHDDSS